jgi:putative transposase
VKRLFQNRYRVDTVRLAGYDYASAGWYFVTVCTAGRACMLGVVDGDRVALSLAGRIA